MNVERTDSAFKPVSVVQEQVNELMETFKSLGENDILVLPDSEAIYLVPTPLRDTNFRLRTLVVKPGEKDGIPSIRIYQRHAPIETRNDEEKRRVWASTVGTEGEELLISGGFEDDLDFRRTGSFVDLTLTCDTGDGSWRAEGRSLYPTEKPADLISLATTMINNDQNQTIYDLPLAA